MFRQFKILLTVAWIVTTVSLGTVSLAAQPLTLVPQPVQVEKKEGKFTLTPETKIIAGKGTETEARLLAERIRPSTGLPVTISEGSSGKPENQIILRLDSTAADAKAIPGSYTLSVTTEGVVISAPTPTGVFYGTQTLLQLMPPHVFSAVKVGHVDWVIPCVEITDAPSFGWRGMHLDTARHFFPKAFVKKYIDLMAQMKMNRFHWHIVDSEGWRLEIKKYPKLTQITEDSPAWYSSEDPTDKSRPAKFQYGWFHGGGYYSQEDVKEIVAYAAERHIDVMPEIEFPAHMMAALTAYPGFGTTGKVPTIRSNHSPDLINIDEKSLNFLRDILDETMSLFPFEFIHFGGDEAPKWQWEQSEYVQKRMKELGIKAEEDRHSPPGKDGKPKIVKAEQALQAWLFNEMARHVAKQGKRPVGWEEIMHGNNVETLTKSAVVMPWLSMNSGVKAANSGFDVLVCTTFPFYLDSYQTSDPSDNWTLYGGPWTLAHIYNYEFFPKSLKPENRHHILGAQGQSWSELMIKPENVEYQVFPRAAAIAEILWTPKEKRDYDQFSRRLVGQANRWRVYGVNYRALLPLPSISWTPGEIKTEFSSLESDVTSQIKKAGKYSVTFRFMAGGHGLDIQSVELLENGKSVSADKHDGFAGAQLRNNEYSLKLDKYNSRAKYILRVVIKGSGGTDSKGEIVLE
ncbi:MAG: beta-N-acetylhexosaminidase [Puniceicoccales bacterium]|jgi:hexosaminidase|nr:beta-N-acetylhexosaminidase [Puniceicoccales bacterium]